MFIAAVSTIALALSLGPQLHTSLQVALEDAQPAAESAVETGVSQPEPDPVIELDEGDETDAAADDAAPIEPETMPVIAETPAESDEAASEAATGASAEIPQAEWPAVLSAVSDGLSAAQTATGKFIQTNSDGSLVTGNFALNRPGRMRFDYDDPTPILIVSNGTTVAMEDSELETVDRVPIGSTPLSLILSSDLQVDEDVEVLSILQNDERIGVRVSDATGELEGTLTMIFDKASYDLLGWLAVDGNLQTTVVDLVEVETNVQVDPRLFRLNEDDDEDER